MFKHVSREGAILKWLKHIVLLSCEQLDLCLLLFFAALLQWYVDSLNISPQVNYFSDQSRPCLDFNCSIYLPFSNNGSDTGNRLFETLREFFVAFFFLVEMNFILTSLDNCSEEHQKEQPLQLDILEGMELHYV